MAAQSIRKIGLHCELTWKEAFLFPLRSQNSRKELIRGAILLFIPFIGWLLNLGYRVEMIHRLQHGESVSPGWQNYPRLLKLGAIVFFGMIYYWSPAAFFVVLGYVLDQQWFYIAALLLFLFAGTAIPACMTSYCYDYDLRKIFNPFFAFRLILEGEENYWKACMITVAALALSFFGLLFLGIGFMFSSVWFWQVTGYSFASVFNKNALTINPEVS